MWGAIIGDIAGSIYEFDQVSKVKKIKIDEIIPKKGFYSDDTILTIAIADAVLNNKDYEKYLKQYAKKYENYKPDFEPYFKTSFSPGFTKWVNSNYNGDSKGNGALMRISPIGFCFQTEEDVIKNAYLATIPSHNSDEAIEYSSLISLIIFYAKKGLSKDDIISKLNLKLKYEPFTKFNSTCKETFNNCIYAAFTSKNFNESVEKVISYGGDTDTNACIVGSIAEALYGVDKTLIEKVKTIIPIEFTNVLNKMYSKKITKDDIER